MNLLSLCRKVIDPSLTEDQIEKLVKRDGKISFKEVGKIIGARWRRISETPDKVFYYNSLAKIDAERHAKEKEKYERRDEVQHYEPVRPPNTYHSSYRMPHHMYHIHDQASSTNTTQSSMYHCHMDQAESYHSNHTPRYEQAPFNHNYRYDALHATNQHGNYFTNFYSRPMR